MPDRPSLSQRKARRGKPQQGKETGTKAQATKPAQGTSPRALPESVSNVPKNREAYTNILSLLCVF